ncbi:MAG TPA: efflux RND transporter periplasmic adaptor subunit, partial [Planctomycetota bacterium]|nr:efflux RND transporter periplasmic adaptor subunit [Planctomycetota bacterium]
EQAEATATRLRLLVAEKARTPRELADAEYALRTARANLEAAKSLRAAYAKSGAVIVGDGLPVFELRSPISGVIVKVSATAGENVHTEHAVFTILDASRVWVEARVSEADFNRLGGSSAALLEMPYGAAHLRQAASSPSYVAAEVDPATRTVAVIYDVENGPGDLRIGLAVTLHIETARSEDGIAIPESALVDLEGRFVAFVQLAGETFEKRDLVLGIRDGGFAQVVSGLKTGERVVTQGAYAVRLASASASIPAHGHTH